MGMRLPSNEKKKREFPPLRPPEDYPFTAKELAKFDGSDPELPVYVAIKGVVFDVTWNRTAYAPGSGYHVFAGKDASKALGMSSLKAEDCTADYSSLNDKQRETLDGWYKFFMKRYSIVGRVTQN
ncbi:cytochrome b5 [Basidiobolus meristosporus CBS 931.73]|uniref:Cytochrome b5 n=1 Tax=Basidiobolus meristosporus CBS 931.73 TaxID=1314790 RepID=A0A1Y1XTT9_9FUNG|nr:cytochrome b5 [Basidiobolus meristosporus CBS 931.73]|eukprot:ORX89160.1 cytochrome b5 [Basidiobolus meristosporus CBS 931.73]